MLGHRDGARHDRGHERPRSPRTAACRPTSWCRRRSRRRRSRARSRPVPAPPPRESGPGSGRAESGNRSAARAAGHHVDACPRRGLSPVGVTTAPSIGPSTSDSARLTREPRVPARWHPRPRRRSRQERAQLGQIVDGPRHALDPLDHRHDLGQGVVGDERPGGVRAAAVHRDLEGRAHLLADIDVVHHPAGVLDPLAAALVEHVVGAHQLGPSLDQPRRPDADADLLVGDGAQHQVAVPLPALAGQGGEGDRLGGHLALHVERAAAPDVLVAVDAPEGRHRPLVGVGRRPRRCGPAAAARDRFRAPGMRATRFWRWGSSPTSVAVTPASAR